MPQETVTIYIDEKAYEVPKGANLVDVAKFYADNDIPVFCYHPKMAPAGMCRMCLVEQGSIEKDRETGAVLVDENGQPKFRWLPKLQTACTQTVVDGMAIRTKTEAVQAARDDIIEFLLTSHPLDCPICDKGGECPLQNLTMRHGAGTSRFNFEDKMDLEKHVPLGDLIFLDRERCIQCARCTRFCDEVVGDPVLGFHERGRHLQIVTLSEPGFDSYFSGNTTDICPVGALTTADFRFGARPWELNEIPSIDPYGPEGANTSLSTRLDRESGGITIVKRVMPRQNEFVNEIWISDKTRFGHHHSRSGHRLTQPLLRRNGTLVPVSWQEANQAIAEALTGANGSVGAVAGPMVSNEDLWELRQLVTRAGGNKFGVFPATMTGADVIKQVGVGRGTNFLDMGKGSTIIVIASDLEEEAPIWWMRVKRAGDRGANVVSMNARPTKLDQFARHCVPYQYGQQIAALNNLTAKIAGDKLYNAANVRAEGVEDFTKATKADKNIKIDYTAIAQAVAESENVVILVGSEGLTLEQHGALMQAAANLLILTGHVGRPNNGLIAVWPGANTQGALDLGYRAEMTADALAQQVVIIAGADPVGTDTQAAAALRNGQFVIATSLFDTATTAMANLVLPRQSVPERDGTFTSGERRVQRFYTAQGALGETRPEWKMFVEIHRWLDATYKPKASAAAVMADINKNWPLYADMTYKNLALVARQFPDVGGEDLYYGGTAYNNKGGVGAQWATEAENAETRLTLSAVKAPAEKAEKGSLTAVPVRVLYDRSPEFLASELMHPRIPAPYVEINSADAKTLNVADGETVTLAFGDQRVRVTARVDGIAPAGSILIPQNMIGQPVPAVPTAVVVEK